MSLECRQGFRTAETASIVCCCVPVLRGGRWEVGGKEGERERENKGDSNRREEGEEREREREVEWML